MNDVGKYILAAPHSIIDAHPQLIPTLERSGCVEAYFENRLSNKRLQDMWQSRDVEAIIIFGPLLTAAQLSGLPPRNFALILINPPFSLPEDFSREPMCTVIKQTGDSLDLRMWGQGERYAEILCQLVLGLYANLHIELDNVNFTEKEKEVLHMLLQGLRDDYIARALFISPKTVRNHISNMLRKVRVDSRTQLVLWALQKKKRS
ncbi:MAG: response regulator transcription factor [Firmicutes bacterium]|nr:response regulator transcription factor [Bacillota bacterium]HPZ91453.1 response regulator transcription factor [Bacillota bacterium]